MRLTLELAHEAAFQQDAFAVAAFAVEDVAEVLVAFEERGGPHGLKVLIGVLVGGQPLHEPARLFDLFGLHVLRVDVHLEGVLVAYVVGFDVGVHAARRRPPCAVTDADAASNDHPVLLGDIADGVRPAILVLAFGDVEFDADAVERLPVLGGAFDGGDATVELFAVLSDADVSVLRVPHGLVVAGVGVDGSVDVVVVLDVSSVRVHEAVAGRHRPFGHAVDDLVGGHRGHGAVGDEYHD